MLGEDYMNSVVGKVKETAVEARKVTFDEVKTQELVAGMKEQGIDVGIENLSKYIRTQGVLVHVHIGGGRKEINVSPKIYGVNEDEMGAETQEFLKKHMKKGKVTFLPEEYDKRLKQIDARVRKTRREYACGMDDSFMTMGIFKEFKKYFDENCIEFFELRDEIIANFDSFVQRFKVITEKSLEELNAIDKARELERIFSVLPTKEQYLKSFYMNLTVKAFPIAENMDVFDEEIKNSIQDGLDEDTVGIIYEGIGRTLSDAFLALSGILNGCDKDKIHHKVVDGLKNSIKRVGLKNVFCNNKVEKVKKEMEELVLNIDDIFMVQEKAECLLAEIYGYATELKIVQYIDTSKCPLNPKELLSIFEDYTGSQLMLSV